MSDWTYDQDAFLVRWSGVISPEQVATHDLGKESGEGAKRMRWLRKRGMIELIADAQIAKIKVGIASLNKKSLFALEVMQDEIDAWELIRSTHRTSED